MQRGATATLRIDPDRMPHFFVFLSSLPRIAPLPLHLVVLPLASHFSRPSTGREVISAIVRFCMIENGARFFLPLRGRRETLSKTCDVFAAAAVALTFSLPTRRAAAAAVSIRCPVGRVCIDILSLHWLVLLFALR